MIQHFPPTEIDTNDDTFLVIENIFFAKLKREKKTSLKNIFLTENVLVFVLKGYKHLHIDNDTIEVTPKEVIFLKKGIYAMAEYFEDEQEFEAVLLFLHPKILHEIIAEYKLSTSDSSPHTPFLKIETNQIIENFKSQLKLYFTHNSLKDKGLLLLKQKEILLYILKTIPYTNTSPFWDSVISTSQKSMEYVMEKYLFQKLSLKDYASLTNRSLSSFKRDFTAFYQTSPIQWINKKRLEYACLLLKNTPDRISDISEACGFESLSYFTQIFRRTYNLSPSEFRADR